MKSLFLAVTLAISLVCSISFGQALMDSKPPELSPYVFWFGPVGVAFGIVALLIGFFYRKDVMERVKDGEARERTYHAMLVSNAAVLQEVSNALARQASTNEKVSQAVLAFIEHLTVAERRMMEGRG